MTKRSPALSLMDIVWQTISGSPSPCYAAMRGALLLAIEAGVMFEMRDIKYIAATMHGDAWLDGECMYRSAVDARNVSACLSLETYLKREAWVLRGQRLAVGSLSPWGVVTSMGPLTFYACGYWPNGKLKTRRKVTRGILRMANTDAAGLVVAA